MADLSYKYVINTELKINAAELDAKLQTVKQALDKIDIKPKSVSKIKKDLDTLSKTVHDIMGKEVTLLPKDDAPYTEALSYLHQIAKAIDKVMETTLAFNQELTNTTTKYKNVNKELAILNKEKAKVAAAHAKDLGITNEEDIIKTAHHKNFREAFKTDDKGQDLDWRFKSVATAETAKKKVLNTGAAVDSPEVQAIQAEIDIMVAFLAQEEEYTAAKEKIALWQAKVAIGTLHLVEKEKELLADKAALTTQIEAEAGAVKNLGEAMEVLVPAINDAETGLQTASGALEKNSDEVKKNYEAQDELTKKIKTFVTVTLAAMAVRAFRDFIRDSINHIKELDKALTSIATVSGNTRKQMWELSGEFNRMARELGRTTTEVAVASEIFYRQGKTTSQVMALTRASLISASVAGISATEASNRLTAALNGFTLEASEAMNVADKFAALAARSASSFDELSSALSKTASSAYTAGMDMDYMLGFLAKTIEATREAPENLGTAFKTIIARMQQIREVGFAQDEDGTDFVDVNRVETALNSIGVLLRDKVTKQFRPLQQVFDDMGAEWEGLNRNTKAYLATILSGSRQQSRFLALMNNYDRTLQLVAISQNSAGEASRQFSVYLTGLEAATKRLSASKEQLMQKLMPPELQEGLLKFFTGLLETVSRLPTPLVYLTAGLLAMTFALGASALAFKVQSMAAKDYNGQSLKDLLIMKINTQMIKDNTRERMLNAEATWAQVAAQLASQKAAATKKLFSIGTNPIYAAIAAITALIFALTWLATIGKRNSEQRQKDINEAEAKIVSLNREIKSTEALAEEYDELNRKIIKTTEERKRLKEISEELQNNYPNLIAYIDEEGIAHMDTAAAIEEANAKRREAIALEKEALAKRKVEVAYQSKKFSNDVRRRTENEVDNEGNIIGSYTHIEPLTADEQKQLATNARDARNIAIREGTLSNKDFGAEENNVIAAIVNSMKLKNNDVKLLQTEMDARLTQALDVSKGESEVEKLTLMGRQFRDAIKTTLKDLTSAEDSISPDMNKFSKYINDYSDALKAAGVADPIIERMLQTGNKTLDYISSVSLALNKIGVDLKNIKNLNSSAFATLAQNLDGKEIKERNDDLIALNDILGKLSPDVLQKINKMSDKLDTTSTASILEFNTQLEILKNDLSKTMPVEAQSLYNFLVGNYKDTKVKEEIISDAMKAVQDFFKQQEKIADLYSMIEENQEFSLQKMAETIMMFPQLAKHITVVEGKLTLQKTGVEALWEVEKKRFKFLFRAQINELTATKTLLQMDSQRLRIKLIDLNNNKPNPPKPVEPSGGYGWGMAVSAAESEKAALDALILESIADIAGLEEMFKHFDALVGPSGLTGPKVEPYIMAYTELERILARVAFLQDEISAVQDLRPFLQSHKQKVELLAIEEEQLSLLAAEQENLMRLYETERNQAASKLMTEHSQYIKFDEWGFVQLTDKINSAGNTTKEAIDDLIDKYNENTQGLRETERALVENSKAVMEAARTRMEITFDEELRKLEELLFEGSTQQKVQDEFDLKEAEMKKWLSYEEKTLEISKIRGSLEKSLREAITSGQESVIANEIKMLDVMESQDKLSRKDLESMQKKFAIKELEMRLENLRNQKTIQTLRRMADGTWQFQYEVDIEAIEDTQEKLRDAKLEQIKFEKDAQFNADKEQFDNKVKFLDRIREVTQRALAGEFATQQEFLDELGRVHELFSNKVYLGGSSIWDTISTKWGTITTNMTTAYEGFITALNTYTITAIANVQALNLNMQGLLATLKAVSTIKPPTLPSTSTATPFVATRTNATGFVSDTGKVENEDVLELGLASGLKVPLRNYVSDRGGEVGWDESTGRIYVKNADGSLAWQGTWDTLNNFPTIQSIPHPDGGSNFYATEQDWRDILHFQKGGVIDYTGPAMVHGSRTNPEVVFNADDASKLYNIVRSLPNISMLGEIFNKTISTPAVPSTTNTQQQVYNIDKLEFPNVRDSEQIKKAIESLPRYVLQQTRTVTK